MRDVEEMLDDEDLQRDVARVRGRARDIRRDFNRHSKVPQWGLVDEQVTKPLAELRERIDEELAKREKPDARLPLDRDPVPSEFEELVRRYYEQLGSGK